MSTALHSLMRDVPPARPQRSSGGSVLAFLAVGSLGALAFVVLSSALVWMHTGYADWLVKTASYAALIGPVYLLHRRYSFKSDTAHHRALPRYLAVQGMAVLLAAAFSFGAHEIAGLPNVVASVVVVVLTASVNYLVLRSWAFAHRQTATALAI